MYSSQLCSAFYIELPSALKRTDMAVLVLLLQIRLHYWNMWIMLQVTIAALCVNVASQGVNAGVLLSDASCR